MEGSELFRKKSIERVSTPEKLNDYLKATSPAVWVALTAIILIIAGAVVWGITTYIHSAAKGTAEVKDGKLVVVFDDPSQASNVKEGLTVKVGGTSSTITSVGMNQEGKIIAVADTTLADGTYTAEVRYKTTQLIKLIFN